MTQKILHVIGFKVRGGLPVHLPRNLHAHEGGVPARGTSREAGGENCGINAGTGTLMREYIGHLAYSRTGRTALCTPSQG